MTIGAQTYTNVPGGPALWSFTGNGNHNSASGSVSIVISKANATIHVSGWSGEYDGFYSRRLRFGQRGSLGESLSGLLNLGRSFTRRR